MMSGRAGASLLWAGTPARGEIGRRVSQWRVANQAQARRVLTAEQPTTKPRICTPASASATEAAVTPAEMSSSDPSDSRIVMKRSICDFGSDSSTIAGSSDCCSVADSVGLSVSCKANRRSVSIDDRTGTSSGPARPSGELPFRERSAARPTRRART